MLPIHCLIWILTIAKLPYAFAYVAQPSLALTQPPSVTTNDETIAACLNNSCSSTLQEDAPLSFNTSYRWKNPQSAAAAPDTTFDRHNFYNTMLELMAGMTSASWENNMDGVRFRSAYGIVIKFVKDKSGPGLKAKYLVWALLELFDILVEANRYEIGIITVNTNWDEGRVAFGSVTLHKGDDNTALDDNGGLDLMTLSPPSKPPQNNSSLESSHTLLPSLPTPQNLTADPSVSCILQYHPNGASFPDYQIYNASLKWLAQIAPIEDQQRPIRFPISSYNDVSDFTLSLRPVSFAKRSELSYNIAAHMLAYLAVYVERPVELSGLISFRGRPTGVVCIDKGDRRGWPADRLCEAPEEDGVATA